jgi:ABC-type ATPase involved in cell division
VNTIRKLFQTFAIAALLIATPDFGLAECPCQASGGNNQADATQSITGKITQVNRRQKTIAISVHDKTYWFRLPTTALRAKIGETVQVTYVNWSGGLPRAIDLTPAQSQAD